MAPTTPIGSRVISASALRAGRRDLVVDLVDGLGVPGDAARGGADVDGQRVLDGLAHVQRFEQRQFLAGGEDLLGKAQQHLLARRGDLPAQRPSSKARARRRTAASTSAALAARHLRQQAAVDRRQAGRRSGRRRRRRAGRRSARGRRCAARRRVRASGWVGGVYRGNDVLRRRQAFRRDQSNRRVDGNGSRRCCAGANFGRQATDRKDLLRRDLSR